VPVLPSKTLAMLATAAFCLAGCGDEPQKPAPAAVKQAPAPQIPADVQEAAETALGAEVAVLEHGNLSLGGQPQILAANLLKTTPKEVAPGTLFTRLVLLGKEKDKWKELLICTGHLQNPAGYLGGTPLAPINGWRLQKEMSKTKGLVMYFTPIQQPVTGNVRAISVLWNPQVKRYQSLDYNYVNFLTEVKSIEKPETFLH